MEKLDHIPQVRAFYVDTFTLNNFSMRSKSKGWNWGTREMLTYYVQKCLDSPSQNEQKIKENGIDLKHWVEIALAWVECLWYKY